MSSTFLFHTGTWIGEGTIAFSASQESVHFYTKWQISSESELLHAVQTVEMRGVDEQVVNYFEITNLSPSSFTVHLQSESIGSAYGSGVIEPRMIFWQFEKSSSSSLNGYEKYMQEENGSYSFQAQYSSIDQEKTLIEGVIWQKEAC